MDRDQLAALLQVLAIEPAVPRKTARVVRCGVLSTMAASLKISLLPVAGLRSSLHTLALDDALAPQVQHSSLLPPGSVGLTLLCSDGSSGSCSSLGASCASAQASAG